MTNDDEQEPIGEISLESALDIMTGAKPSAEVLGAPAVDGDGDGGEMDSARDHLAETIVVVTIALVEAERHARDEDRSRKPTGKLRRAERARLLRDLEKAISDGVIAAVAWVMYADAETEADGIAAMCAAAPMVVELQALRARAYRLLRGGGGGGG